MKSFVMMLSFFTRIPVRAKNGIDEAAYKKGIKYLPLIALILGAAAGAVSLLRMWIDPYLAAFLTLLVYLLLTGGLHLDGLADTMDAFGANRDRERTLAILKDSHIGTFGVVGVCVCIVGMTIALAGADAGAAWLFPLAGRTAAMLCARCFACARPGGLGQWFIDGVKWTHIIVSTAVYAAAAAVICFDFSRTALAGLHFAVLMGSFAVALGVVALIVKRFSRQIGGVTGDIIGFSVEASQLFYLLLLGAAMQLLG
jgi:adenosylcobinamide-GDP ribazoletransferase